MAKLDDGPILYSTYFEIIKLSFFYNYSMLCSICNRISATGRDHIDCIEKARLEMENEDLKKKAITNLGSSDIKLGKELQALLEHMNKSDTN